MRGSTVVWWQKTITSYVRTKVRRFLQRDAVSCSTDLKNKEDCQCSLSLGCGHQRQVGGDKKWNSHCILYLYSCDHTNTLHCNACQSTGQCGRQNWTDGDTNHYPTHSKQPSRYRPRRLVAISSKNNAFKIFNVNLLLGKWLHRHHLSGLPPFRHFYICH